MEGWKYMGKCYRFSHEIDEGIVTLLRPLCEKYGINTVYLNALHEVAQSEKITMSSLAKKLSIAVANLTPVCKKMEQIDLITRQRSASDGRVVFIEATEKGLAIMNEAHQFMQKVFEDLYELRGEEIEQTLVLLESLNDGIREVMRKQPGGGTY